jgi:hypothetical protein
MTEEYCVCCDVLVAFCINRKPAPVTARAPTNLFTSLLAQVNKGVWFPASWPSECSSCGIVFDAGDEIRADGDGGWEARCCDD